MLNTGAGQSTGRSSRLPLSKARPTSTAVRLPNGARPYENTSHTTTPKLHTSLFVVNTWSWIDSSAIHFSGSTPSLTVR